MWKLTVGSDDLTSYVTFLNLSETASSSQDSGGITVNGTHSSIVPGASVTLTDASGNTAWEGYVLSSSAFPNSTGIQVATLANKCSVGYHYGSASGNDVAVLAQGLLSATSIPWGGPANFGLEVGGLSFDRVDSGLSLLSMLAGSTWRVQNGQCVFVNAVSGIADIPVSLQTTPNAYSSVNILGGADISTRIPLSQTVVPIGSPLGPVGQVSYHEIADTGTLGILAANLGEMYGLGAVSASATLSQTVRAGDWVQDTNGIVTVAWQVKWSIVAGLLQAAVQFGFPALSQEPQYSPAFSDAMHRFPVSRLTSDYVVQGCSASTGSGGVNMTSGLVVVNDTLQSAMISGLAVPPSGVSYIAALPSSTSYQVLSDPALPGQGVNLYRVTMQNGNVIGLTDIRQHGGSGSNNVQPNALYPAHFSGDTSGDRSVAIFNAATKTVNHVVMSQPTQARILSDNTLKVDGTTGPVSGNLPYLNHNPDLQGSFHTTGSGYVNAPASTFLNLQGSMGVVGGVPSSLPYTSTTSSITLNLPSATLKRADQSTIPISGYSPVFSGLSAGTTYYVLAGIDVVHQQWFANLAASAFSGTQVVTNGTGTAADGYFPVFTNSTAATTTSGTGGGTGGGGNQSCPAVWQSVLTKERGYMRADEVEIGMHLPGPSGWVRVLDAMKLPAPIWRYTLRSQDAVESFDVNDTHAVMLEDGAWGIIREIKGGERVLAQGGLVILENPHFVRDDHYIAFTVEGHEFMMGDALCHNINTF